MKQNATTCLVFGAAFCGFAMLTLGCSRSHAEAASSSSLERGRYLVERVGMCIDCHSPRLQDGNWDKANWLGGSLLAFAPAVPMPVWANYAPPLAGLPGFTDEQAIRLLETGKNRGGQPPRPPMPEYRMNREDAEAVVAYLRSLAQKAP